MIWLLTQSRLSQHLQKLFLRTHIDRLRYQFSFTVIHETLGDSVDTKHVVRLAPWVEQDWICDRMLGEIRFYLADFFIINRQDYESLIFEFPVKRIEVRHLFSTGRTPGGPEIHQHNLPA